MKQKEISQEELAKIEQSLRAQSRKDLKDFCNWRTYEGPDETLQGQPLYDIFLKWANVPDMSPANAPAAKISEFLKEHGYGRVVNGYATHLKDALEKANLPASAAPLAALGLTGEIKIFAGTPKAKPALPEGHVAQVFKFPGA